MYVKLRLCETKKTNKIAKEKWDNSGAAEHSLTCHGQFNWIHPKTIVGKNSYRKRKIW